MEGFVSHQSLGLDLLSNGQAPVNLDNACRVLQNHPAMAGTIWYDEFHGTVRRRVDGQTRDMLDTDKYDLTAWMQRDVRLRKMSDDTVRKAIHLVASRNARNEPLEWLNGLAWDGEPRLATLLRDYFGTTDSAYHAAVGTNFIRSLVARLLRPGAKVDTMPIFQGLQGSFKSQAMEILGGDWYAIPTAHVTHKDFFEGLRGVWLMEIPEMDIFTRAEIGAVKALLSSRMDRYRKSYGELVAKYLRSVVFAGTVNPEKVLKDPTGARRFWPIACGAIAVEYLRRDRDQIFAEAVADVRAGKSWWHTPEGETLAAQEAARQIDEWQPIIERHLTHTRQTSETSCWWEPRAEPIVAISTGDVLVEALDIPVGRWTHQDQERVANCMRALKRIAVKVNGTWLWRER
jgi:predicted P-loop ATPase